MLLTNIWTSHIFEKFISYQYEVIPYQVITGDDLVNVNGNW